MKTTPVAIKARPAPLNLIAITFAQPFSEVFLLYLNALILLLSQQVSDLNRDLRDLRSKI